MPAESLPYTPDQPPLVASLTQHSKVFSSIVYPIPLNTARAAPLTVSKVGSHRACRTDHFWGWGLSRLEDLALVEKAIGLFPTEEQASIRRWETMFRDMVPASRRGANLPEARAARAAGDAAA